MRDQQQDSGRLNEHQLKQNDGLKTVEKRSHSKDIVLSARQLEQIVETPNVGGQDQLLTILHALDLEVIHGEQLAITGRSGSGKSTLLGLLAGLDRASRGEIYLCGQPLHLLNEDERAKVRLQHVGFVFQSFQLLNHLTALENVLLPLTLSKTVSPKQAKTRSLELLERVGLSHRLQQTPKVLSGGEQQRVAIARALVTQPEIIFADEPTGNLDGHTASDIEDLLFNINQENGTTLILVTHDQNLAKRCNRQVLLKDGRLFDPTNASPDKHLLSASVAERQD